MVDTSEDLHERIRRLERRVRIGRSIIAILTFVVIALGLGAWTSVTQQPAVVRARALVIEDEAGRDRIVLGAPVPDPKEGKRISPSVGLVINDAEGLERFGVGLQTNGRLVMGFDAPPGTGDPRNRERINIVADATGGAYIRFLNRKTFVPGRLILDDNDQFYLEFLDFPEGRTISRRIRFNGDERIEQKR
jgi:hypothetical protein